MKKAIKKIFMLRSMLSVLISGFLVILAALPTYAIDLSDLKMPNEKATAGTNVPNVRLFDSNGKTFNLKDIMDNKPLIISMIYTRCPSACSVVTGSLRSAVTGTNGLGKNFNVLSVSFDTRDKPENLETFRKKYGFDGKTWRVASGEEEEIKKLVTALDFRYIYDPSSEEFMHPNFSVVLTPDGRISKYVYGMSPRARELRLSVLEAKKGSSSFSLADGFLLKCFRFNPATKTYNVDWAFLLNIFIGITSIIFMILFAFGRHILSLVKKMARYVLGPKKSGSRV